MKKFYYCLVTVDDVKNLRKALKANRVKSKDWGRSKKIKANGVKAIGYTILCTEEVFENITSAINGTRIF